MSTNTNDPIKLPELGPDFFDAFEDATYEDWKAEAIRTLKGAPFEKKLLTKTHEGILLQPIYNADDIADLPTTGAAPGEAPYVRGNRAAGYTEHPWRIAQETVAAEATECNRQITDALERGATAVNLVLHGAHTSGLPLVYMGDFKDVFEGVDLSGQPIFIQCGALGFGAASMLMALARENDVDSATLSGSVGGDPLDTLASRGTIPAELNDLYDEMAAFTAWSKKNAPRMSTLPVHTHTYHDAGAHAAQELACALATSVEYLREMTQRDIAADDAAERVQWSLSVGGDFFMEIAKLRAARGLWSQATAAFGVSLDRARLRVHGRTSDRFMSTLDPHTNLLRATTSAYAAIIGGVDSLHTAAFDVAGGGTDDFSRRVARNLQSVLKDECHLDRLVDPAGGSYYVEQLTDELARGAWSLFQEIERRGGMSAALGSGFIQERIRATAEARLADMHTRKAVQVGVNKYADLGQGLGADEPKAEIDLDSQLENYKSTMRSTAPLAPFATEQNACSADRFQAALEAALEGASLDEISPIAGEPSTLSADPLHPMRTAQPYEDLRRRCAKSAPRVFLANLGPIPQHKPRADFSRDFFSVGGFEVLSNDGFETPEAAATAAVESGAPIAVICSTDADYPDAVPRFLKALGAHKEKLKVILAGYPKDQAEAHRTAGVDEFIHLRANNHQILETLLTQTGGAL